MAVQNYRQIIGLYNASIFEDGRISTPADPTSTRRAISRTAHL